ncbi:hypothetical protein F5883DRAFT_40129 [Diaporthe sp. PMI_573]|nr:hypothetical protein F5883DRAFT_40129 [Diaporthaceae sp. PMI_573]
MAPKASQQLPQWQKELEDYYQPYGITPRYQFFSDKRGGRTAWSCEVIVGLHKYEGRFWFKGHHNAKEDAAEVALKALGQA